MLDFFFFPRSVGKVQMTALLFQAWKFFQAFYETLKQTLFWRNSSDGVSVELGGEVLLRYRMPKSWSEANGVGSRPGSELKHLVLSIELLKIYFLIIKKVKGLGID